MLNRLAARVENLPLRQASTAAEIVVCKADHLLDVRSNELWSADLRPLVLHTSRS